jgi:hypothetical protein
MDTGTSGTEPIWSGWRTFTALGSLLPKEPSPNCVVEQETPISTASAKAEHEADIELIEHSPTPMNALDKPLQLNNVSQYPDFP